MIEEILDTLEVWEACSSVIGEMMDTLEVWEECTKVLDTLE